MPKIVDYAARFEFLREAAFAVVLEDGPAALSRRAVADTLGIPLTTVRRLVTPTASLRAIAAQAVERRRSHGRGGIPRSDDPAQNAVRLIASVLPNTDDRIEEEIVWLTLVLAHPSALPVGAKQDVRERYQLFDHDWAEPGEGPNTPRDDQAMARAIAERECFVRNRLHVALEELAVAEDERRAVLGHLRTMVDGLTLAVVLGHLTPAEAMQQVEELVARLSRLET